MITSAEEKYILKNARVPEHIPPLMVGISQAVPFLIANHFCLAKDNWLIFIGYPLEGDFVPSLFVAALREAMERINPAQTWFIAPQESFSLDSESRITEVDEYLKFEIGKTKIKGSLIREVKKASLDLTLEKNRRFSPDHTLLMQEFLEDHDLPPRVRELYLRMPAYLSQSPTSLLLSAWTKSKNLSAFYVLDLSAEKFATYVVGCFSRENYVPHASDVLFGEMIRTAEENRKEYIHLGLGVNEGIRRFKMKWGGIPYLKYFVGEIPPKKSSPFSWLRALASRV